MLTVWVPYQEHTWWRKLTSQNCLWPPLWHVCLHTHRNQISRSKACGPPQVVTPITAAAPPCCLAPCTPCPGRDAHPPCLSTPVSWYAVAGTRSHPCYLRTWVLCTSFMWHCDTSPCHCSNIYRTMWAFPRLLRVFRESFLTLQVCSCAQRMNLALAELGLLLISHSHINVKSRQDRGT